MTSGDNRQLNAALERFLEARLFYRVLHSNAGGIPLGAETKSSRYTHLTPTGLSDSVADIHQRKAHRATF
jgi:hypothetical protein